jgi:hypothetical protein
MAPDEPNRVSARLGCRWNEALNHHFSAWKRDDSGRMAR